MLKVDIAIKEILIKLIGAKAIVDTIDKKDIGLFRSNLPRTLAGEKKETEISENNKFKKTEDCNKISFLLSHKDIAANKPSFGRSERKRETEEVKISESRKEEPQRESTAFSRNSNFTRNPEVPKEVQQQQPENKFIRNSAKETQQQPENKFIRNAEPKKEVPKEAQQQQPENKFIRNPEPKKEIPKETQQSDSKFSRASADGPKRFINTKKEEPKKEEPKKEEPKKELKKEPKNEDNGWNVVQKNK